MKAERERRANVTEAEGFKRAEVLRAEGERDARIAQAEGEQKAQIAEAKGEAEAIREVANAKGEELRILKMQLGEQGVADYLVALRYMETLDNMAKKQQCCLDAAFSHRFRVNDWRIQEIGAICAGITGGIGVSAPHPGELVDRLILQPAAISQSELARRLGFNQPQPVNELVKGKRGFYTEDGVAL